MNVLHDGRNKGRDRWAIEASSHLSLSPPFLPQPLLLSGSNEDLNQVFVSLDGFTATQLVANVS